MKTLVTFLLDRTGSMQSIVDDTIGAFNAYIDGLKTSGEDFDFTLIQFDSQSLDKICVKIPVAQVDPLTKATYVPRASTPLIDAAYKTIKAVEKSLNGDSETKVIVCIQTDGHENASTEHTWDELNAIIKEKTALGWQFNFMGAGIDAYDTGARMGIQASGTMSYNRANSAQAMRGLAEATTLYASGARPDSSFTMAARASARDAFAHKAQPKTGAATPPNPAQTFTIAPKAAKTKIVDDLSL